ncbi:MAG: DUF6163 family protein, partial [Pseudomonadota bacterium]
LDVGGIAETAYLWFVRLMAVLSLMATVGYWAGLSGFSNFFNVEPFGTQAVPITVLHVSLALLAPVAMLGLWLRTRWGATIWLFGLIAQVLAHTVWADTFGVRWNVVTANMISIAAFVLIAGVLAFVRWQQAANVP